MTSMKTFRETLVWSTFDGTFPPFLSAEEREAYWLQRPHRASTSCSRELSRARELGVLFRTGRWTAADETEFNQLADQPDSFSRHQAHIEQNAQLMDTFARMSE